jgi:hypothetical protein
MSITCSLTSGIRNQSFPLSDFIIGTTGRHGQSTLLSIARFLAGIQTPVPPENEARQPTFHNQYVSQQGTELEQIMNE